MLVFYSITAYLSFEGEREGFLLKNVWWSTQDLQRFLQARELGIEIETTWWPSSPCEHEQIHS